MGRYVVWKCVRRGHESGSASKGSDHEIIEKKGWSAMSVKYME